MNEPTRETPPPSATGLRVELADVGRVYPDGPGGAPRVAVESIDLTIEAGELVALVGPSGCGKSTLLRLVAGLDSPTSGVVRLGDPHSAAPLAARSRNAATGYVFQDATLMPWRTVEDNVALPLEIAGVGRAERRAAARDALAEVGLAGEGRVHPNQLSGGMRMRASIARALVGRPRLLLMDEPFAAVDEITRQALDQQLRELWERTPITLLFVTHSVAEAVYLAQRVLVLTPRPARIAADLAIDLPPLRCPPLRAEASYAHEVGRVQAVLSRSGRASEAAAS